MDEDKGIFQLSLAEIAFLLVLILTILLTVQLQTVSSEKAQLEVEKSALTQERAKLQEEKDVLAKEKNQLRQDIVSLENRKANLEKSNAQLEKQRESLANENSSQNELINRLLRQNTALLEKSNELSQALGKDPEVKEEANNDCQGVNNEHCREMLLSNLPNQESAQVVSDLAPSLLQSFIEKERLAGKNVDASNVFETELAQKEFKAWVRKSLKQSLSIERQEKSLVDTDVYSYGSNIIEEFKRKYGDKVDDYKILSSLRVFGSALAQGKDVQVKEEGKDKTNKERAKSNNNSNPQTKKAEQEAVNKTVSKIVSDFVAKRKNQGLSVDLNDPIVNSALREDFENFSTELSNLVPSTLQKGSNPLTAFGGDIEANKEFAEIVNSSKAKSVLDEKEFNQRLAEVLPLIAQGKTLVDSSLLMEEDDRFIDKIAELELKISSVNDDKNKQINLYRRRNEAQLERIENLEQQIVALNKENTNLSSLNDQYEGRYQELDSRLQKVRDKANYLQSRLSKSGFGYPPCWIPAEGEPTRYIIKIIVNSPNSVTVLPAWPDNSYKSRAEEVPPIMEMIRRKNLTMSDFLELGRQVNRSYVSKGTDDECRYFAILDNNHISDRKAADLARYRVNSIFYVYETR